MKLKYYLRGIGLGVVLTAIIMGFALGARNAPVSDAEVIEKAKGLGMVEGGVLSDYSDEGGSTAELEEEKKPDLSAPDKKVADAGDVADAGSEVPDSSLAGDVSEETADDSTKPGTDGIANSVGSVANKAAASGANSSAKDSDKGKDEKADKDKANKEKPVINKKNEEPEEEPEEAAPEEAAEEPAQEPAEAPADNAVPATGEKVDVVIRGGSSSDTVAKILYDAGLVDNAASFNKFLIEQHKDTLIKSGNKSIPRGASYAEILEIITKK